MFPAPVVSVTKNNPEKLLLPFLPPGNFAISRFMNLCEGKAGPLVILLKCEEEKEVYIHPFLISLALNRNIGGWCGARGEWGIKRKSFWSARKSQPFTVLCVWKSDRQYESSLEKSPLLQQKDSLKGLSIINISPCPPVINSLSAIKISPWF